jgi:uncharacterized membrane protein YgcG
MLCAAAKAVIFSFLSARLKSCPDTRQPSRLIAAAPNVSYAERAVGLSALMSLPDTKRDGTLGGYLMSREFGTTKVVPEHKAHRQSTFDTRRDVYSRRGSAGPGSRTGLSGAITGVSGGSFTGGGGSSPGGMGIGGSSSLRIIGRST